MDSRIAVVGMACRYADANTPAQLWENVLAQRRAFRRMPDVRLNLADYHSDDVDATYVREAAVLTNYEFDRERFRISGSTYRSTDLTHWLALEVAADALHDAGFADGDGLPKISTSVILGNTLTGEFSRASLMRLRFPYVRRVLEASLEADGWSPQDRGRFLQRFEHAYKEPFPVPTEETLAGGLANTIAGRICNYYDLKGGGYTVDGACASSLLAMTTACRDLVSGDVDVAVAGGVDLSLDPFEMVGFARTGALTPDKMYVFDEKSRGFIPGEGCGIVVLMRYEDALAENKRIYAIIRGWGISSDGHGGITRPETDGQQLALRRAYDRAGIDIGSVGYFEAHGTGTAVGDATELKTLITLLEEADQQREPAYVGSIKALIGHTKAAAGTAALIKSMMALHHRILPPTAGCEIPMDVLKRSPALDTLREARPWVSDEPLRVGVSAMGFGGINSHLVLEAVNGYQRDDFNHHEHVLVSSVQDAELFLFAARTPSGLREQLALANERAAELSYAEMGDYAAWLAENLRFEAVRAAIVAATPAQFAERLSLLVSHLDEARFIDPAKGVFYVSEKPPRHAVGFMFTGQGANINRDSGLLGRRFEVVKRLFERHPLPAGDNLGQTDIVQPGIVRASLAGLILLDHLGIHATAVMGHSLGELTALHYAGALDAEAVFALASRRGHIMASLTPNDSGMVSIITDEATTRTLIEGMDVVIAGLNAPDQTVVSGAADELRRVMEKAKQVGVRCINLPVSHAFHSPLVKPAAQAFAEELADHRFDALQRDVYSTVTGQKLDTQADIAALLHDQIVRPVRFIESLREMAQHVDLFIEVGPGQILTGLAKRVLNDALPILSLDLDGTSISGILKAAGCAFTMGIPVRHDALFEDRFTRPFNAERPPAFLVNPCELAPEVLDSAAASSGAAVEIITHADKLEASEDDSPLGIVCSLVARVAELPLASIHPENRMLSDLHLNSILVTQIVLDTAQALHIPPPMSPTQYANASVQEIAEALSAQNGSRREAPSIRGLENWVRCFKLEMVEQARDDSGQDGEVGNWQILGDDPFAQQLDAALDIPGNGLVVCLPEAASEADVEFVLGAMQSILIDPPLDDFCFALVQRSGGSFAGMARSLHLEAGRFATCVIHLPDAAVHQQIEWTLAELRGASGFTEVTYTADGLRLTPVLRQVDIPANAENIALSSSDVLLVTGGGKGITAECALAIAQKTGVRLALVGRSEPGSPELAANLERMRQHGVDFLYISGDVSRADDVQRIVEQVQSELGTITAILHGAARNVPTTILGLDSAAVQETLAPKVMGAEYLLNSISPDQLRFFITFGSIIGRVGLPGEADYALANDWLTALTEKVQAEHPACHCLALEWSVWSGTGMGERLGTLEQLQRQGISPISPDQGIDMLLRLLANPTHTTLIVTGRFSDIPTLKQHRPQLPLWRFIEKPMLYYPCVELIADAQISADTDPYLSDHIMESTPLFPAVMGLEAMTQAAMALADTSQIPALTDVAFKHPIIVPPNETITLRLVALRHENGLIDLALRSSQTNFQVDHFVGSAAFDEPQSGQLLVDEPPARTIIPADVFYDDFFFQSGRFRRIDHYEYISARMAFAVLQQDAANWFSMYLPQDLQLGDTGRRDASLHMIQVCVPHKTLLPIGVDRIEFHTVRPDDMRVFAQAVERSVHDNVYTYDLQITDASGRVCETWRGARFQTVEGTSLDGALHPALLNTYLERQLDSLALEFPVHVHVGYDRSTEKVIEDIFQGELTVQHRPDGKPELVATQAVGISASHADGLTLIVSSESTVACDLVNVDELQNWQKLLNADQQALVGIIVENTSLTQVQAAACVWSVAESLTKAGNVLAQVPSFDRVTDGGWLMLNVQSMRAVSGLFDVQGHQFAAALLVSTP